MKTILAHNLPAMDAMIQLGKIDGNLQKKTEKSLKSANGTNSDSDRQAIQEEVSF